jgi:tetratricopeptide (TPR) repeat protein
VIELNPDFGPAYYRWGLLLKNKSDCVDAIEKFQRAVKHKHSYTLDSYGMWGACLENMGKYKEAIHNYQTIIELAPNSNEAQVSRRSIDILNRKIQGNNAK